MLRLAAETSCCPGALSQHRGARATHCAPSQHSPNTVPTQSQHRAANGPQLSLYNRAATSTTATSSSQVASQPASHSAGHNARHPTFSPPAGLQDLSSPKRAQVREEALAAAAAAHAAVPASALPSQTPAPAAAAGGRPPDADSDDDEDE
eukprot:352682-Chlamydomonas_euryale.AAC.6